jgi:hypothetical protein
VDWSCCTSYFLKLKFDCFPNSLRIIFLLIQFLWSFQKPKNMILSNLPCKTTVETKESVYWNKNLFCWLENISVTNNRLTMGQSLSYMKQVPGPCGETTGPRHAASFIYWFSLSLVFNQRQFYPFPGAMTSRKLWYGHPWKNSFLKLWPI